MKLLMVFFLVLSMQAKATDTLLSAGPLRALTNGIKVQGKVEVYRTPDGREYARTNEFKLKGGVVLDLKICGEIFPDDYVCVSLGEPRLKEQSFMIYRPFYKYHKILIFDLDLIQNLAVAELE